MVRSLRAFTCVFMWFNKDDALVDLLGMNIQRSLWIMARVPPCRVVIMSKAILFWRKAFFIRDILVFSMDRLCWLSLEACWGNLVKASMCAVISSRPVEGTKIVAKWLYQWKTECVHQALKKRRLAALGTWPRLHVIHVGRWRQYCWCEMMEWGWDMPDQDPHFLPSFSSPCSISSIMHFNRSGLQQWILSSFLSPRGAK